MHRITILFFIASTFSKLTLAQDSGSKMVLGALAKWHYVYPQEKVYVQQDKHFYSLGETLWFKAYLVNAIDHTFLTPSQTVYVELIDANGVVKARRNLRIKEGAAAGDFVLDPQWQAGAYVMRGYTKYMLNFPEEFLFHRKFEVASIASDQAADTASDREHINDLQVRFFPESGQLVCGLKSKVAVESRKGNEPVPIKARVLNEAGEQVTLFATNNAGLGSFQVTPDCQSDLRIELADDSNASFPLPKPVEEGYVLSILNAHQEEIYVQAASSTGRSLDGAYVLAHVRGENPWLFEPMEGNTFSFKLPADDLPQGIHHLTLFTQADQPVAERLLYIHQPSLVLDIAEPTQLKQRSKVEVKLNLAPLVDTVKIQTALSIFEMAGSPQTNIYTYFLLTSELGEGIYQPASYFADPEKPKLKELDLVMLTHGWRRFTWPDVVNGRLPVLDHFPENGFNLKGVTKRKSGSDQNIAGEVFLSTIGDGFEMISAPTDSIGQFAFRNLMISDSTALILRAQKSDTGKKKKKAKDQPLSDKTVAINLVSHEETISPLSMPSLPLRRFDQGFREAYVETSRYNAEVDLQYANMLTVDLDEVVVTETKLDPEVAHHQESMLYKDPDNRVLMSEFPSAAGYNNLFDFLRGKVPGVEVIGSAPNKTVRIRGINSISLNTTAEFLLDGVRVEPSFLNAYPMDRIAFVDIIKSISKSVALGGNQSGVVAVYTKRAGPGQSSTKSSDLVSFTHPGYYKAREFYEPIGDTPDAKWLDYRTTLHWDPDLDFEGGDAEVIFYTSNKAANYLIVVEGVSSEGKIIYGMKEIRVE